MALRLLSFCRTGDSATRLGILVDGDTIVDLSHEFPMDMRTFLSGGPVNMKKAAELEASPARSTISLSDVSIRGNIPQLIAQVVIACTAPIENPEKIICVGLNYRDHALECGMDIPTEPVLFSKFPSAIVGPNDPIKFPAVGSSQLDYEAELVIVIGKEGHNIKAESALAHVAGYTVGHDVSLRDWQLNKPGGQWMIGKTFDTFAPIGPVVRTLCETDDFDPHETGISCKVNGATMQSSSTSQLIFKTEALLEYISRVVTLKPGDLIFTGTPSGVGIGRDPPVFLKPGDEVVVSIDGIGELRNIVVS